MDTDNHHNHIKEIIQTILEKMGISGVVTAAQNADGTAFSIKTAEAGALIGEEGKNLIALDHIVKRIAEKSLGTEDIKERPNFSLDVNEYQQKRIESLKELARMHAQRVRYFKKEIFMEPMNSYDRRIIHTALTEYPDIITESVGEEPKRCVVVKPYP